MYEDIMRRPMFQTPQQRAGGGIMRGVAPVQRYQEGGSVNDAINWAAEGDFADKYREENIPPEEDLSFVDILKFAPHIPGLIQDKIIGEDDTMSDFWSLDKTEEGSGLNLRDLTDFFVVNPDDPTDVAIATATAGLMATGVGAPGAIAAQLARMGYKGKKVADVIEKVIRTGVGDTRRKTFRRGQTARLAAAVPKLIAGEEVEEVSGEGIASLPQTEEVEEVSSQGIASLPKDSGRFGEGDSKVRNDLANVSKEQLDAYGGSLTQYMNEWNKTGNRPTALRKMAEGDMVSAITPEELADVDLSVEQFEALNESVKKEVINMINDRRGLSRVGYGIGALPGAAIDALTGAGRGALHLGKEIAGSRVGRALGLSEPGEEVEDFELFPLAGSALEGMEENQPITESDLVSALREIPSPPEAPDSVVDEEIVESVEESPTIGERIEDFMSKSVDKLSDPRLQYQLAKAAQPSEGFVPRNFFSDVTLAGAEYDQLQAQKGTALEKNLATLQQLMPDKSPEQLLDILLDQGSDEDKLVVSTMLSLFDSVSKTPQGIEAGPEGTIEIVRNLMGYDKTPSSAVTIDKETGEEIET